MVGSTRRQRSARIWKVLIVARMSTTHVRGSCGGLIQVATLVEPLHGTVSSAALNRRADTWSGEYERETEDGKREERMLRGDG